MQLESHLERTAQRSPERTAIVRGSRRLSFAELETDANRLAHALVELGVRRGDRVAIQLGNSVEAVLAVFAALKAGAVFAMVNPTTKPEKLAHLLDDCGARALFLPARNRAACEAMLGQRESLHAVIAVGKNADGTTMDSLLARHAGSVTPPPKRAIDLDLAAILYTSGSTGAPKGVMLTHANMNAAAESIIAYLENTPDDVILSALPMSFGYGLYQVLMAVRFGGTVVLEPSFAFPHAVLTRLVEERATGLPLVPTMVSILLQMDLSRYDFSALRYVTSAGAALPVEHIERLRGLLPRVRLYSMYGLTECARVTYLPPEELDRRPGSVGRGMPNQEWVIVDTNGRPVAPGDVGELVVRGSHVMRGYWGMPEATAAALRPGPLGDGRSVLHTGDLFRADEEGFLYFIGRTDDVIKSRGEKVSPREVEEVIHRHDDVAEAAVLGVPDAILGQAIKAFVVLKANRQLSERELLRHCADHLEDFMVPQFVEFRPELPKTDNGKIQKRSLQGALA
ncbi:MAG: acyl--CoA ligase [Pirellulales bacterium]|nr:acyl--CoA ligase [Pirellulales bacterium]